MNSGQKLTHLDSEGNACMVDVGPKKNTVRQAVAAGRVAMSAAAYQVAKKGEMAKGDVLGVARIAGIMAAKKVDELIPLTHPLAIENIEIEFQFDDRDKSIEIKATARATGKTGVEMEALTAVSVSALTIYDMCKAVDKSMRINNIRLLSKTGGKSGAYFRDQE